MEKPLEKSRRLRTVILTIMVAVVVLAAYAALTYPKTAVSFPVSFTIGANIEDRELNLSPLHGWAQVEVIVNSGTALWTAAIKNQDENIWDHRANQGGQTIYKSEWIELSGGKYNFTFATAGFGELDADVRVITKGGFW